MAYIYIDVKKVQKEMDRLPDYTSQIRRESQKLSGIQVSAGIGNRQSVQIRKRLQDVRRNLEEDARAMQSFYQTGESVCRAYQRCEQELSGIQAEERDGVEEEAGGSWIEGSDVIKILLDLLTKFGSGGKSLSVFITLGKIAADGDGIGIEDVGNIFKGAGNTILGLIESKGESFRKMVGLNDYFKSGDMTAGWIDRFRTSWQKTFKIKDEVPIKKGTKIAGWALSFIANGFSNYEEYTEAAGTMTAERAVAETVTETLVDIGKGALLTAAAAALLGASAPVVAVGGVACLASAALDIACKNLFEKDLTEAVSDLYLDYQEKKQEMVKKAADKVKAAASCIGDAVAGWWNRLGFA